MTYPERCKSERDGKGFILLDAIVALALSATLISLLSYASLDAQSIHARARLRKELLDAYKAHISDFDGLMPGETRERAYAAVSISAAASWYGNDRIETDIEATSSGQSIYMRAVRKYPFTPGADGAGSPICSPEYAGIAAIAPIMLPIDASLPLTDLQVRDGLAYISADSNRASDPDLIVADIHDPKHPQILASLNTGPGLKSLSIAGNHIYAAAQSSAAQLHVIRMDSTTALKLAKRYQLPLLEASTSPPFGTAIAYASGRVYVGTEKWDGPEVSVLDVRVPEDPAFLGGFETGSKVSSILVRDGIAYISASDQDELRALDVRGQIPLLQTAFSPSGWQRQEGTAAVSFEDDMAFARTAGGFDIAADKEGFLWPHEAAIPYTLNDPGGIYGMTVSRSNVFAITRTPGQELSVFDRTLSTTSAAYYSLPVLPQSITCDLGMIYILAKTAPTIYEVTFTQEPLPR